MGDKDIKKKIKEISYGVMKETVDVVLWELAYLAEVGVSSSRRGAWEAKFKADKFLEEVNFETIKSTIEHLRRRGLVERVGNKKKVWPKITEAGKERLRRLIPRYEKERVWDGRVYLLTYDVPEKRRTERELLRRFIKKLGMGMLQESVWLTPYKPQDILEDFIEKRNLSGTMIDSTIGKDGSIGNEDLKTLIARVYNLDELNKRYKDYIDQVKKKNFIDEIQTQFAYLSILKDDPQLPFELLPSDWLGEEANRVYQMSLRKQ